MKFSGERKLLAVIMDGVGVRESSFGNAFKLARTPNLDQLKGQSLYREIYAHGTYVGMPDDKDLGNSEVGHNAMGAGRIFDQGAKLVQEALESKELFAGTTWKNLGSHLESTGGVAHFIGLLSDGNVHAHIEHLFMMLHQVKKEGRVKTVRLHVLFDGRDVGEKTAELYADKLESELASLRDSSFDVAVASGGGRMKVTMDRYNADWSIVERGWRAHVLGEAPHKFASLAEAVSAFRQSETLTDQNFPPFVIEKNSKPAGTIEDGDGVVFFNFRGDRAIEICEAFDSENFQAFDRQRVPQVYFAGMMEYDGDRHIPKNFLVVPPLINNTLGEYLVAQQVKQFACSETQKFGHVTYFWNGNRSALFDEKYETYVEIPSDKVEFNEKPRMKAVEIVDRTIAELEAGGFQFGRINLANGDMVGHTGDLKAAIDAVEIVDEVIGRLIEACNKTNTILLVTADHGNCDEMFDAKESDYPNWSLEFSEKIKPKTSHTLNPVPLYIYDPEKAGAFELNDKVAQAGLANLANSFLVLMGSEARDCYLPALVKRTHD